MVPAEKSSAELCQEIVLKIIEMCGDQWDNAQHPDEGFKPVISFSSDWGTGLTVALKDTHFHTYGENFAAQIRSLHKNLIEGIEAPDREPEDVILIEEPLE